jgi:hypothetical protein
MRRSAILCIGFLAAIYPGMRYADAAICDGATAASFIAAIDVLVPTYDPQENGDNYQPPTTNGYASAFNRATNSAITDDLTNAFTNAPEFFKTDICKLSGIYISPADCSSATTAYNCTATDSGAYANFTGAWGLRSRAQTDRRSKYISISAALWPGGASARPLSEYETALLSPFMIWLGPTIQTANPNNSWMTVMAALAHELGHVRFVEEAVPNGAGSDYDFSALHQCVINGTPDFFQYWNYKNDQELRPPHYWRQFNDKSNDDGKPIDHVNSPLLFSQLYNSSYFGSSLNRFLYQLYLSTQPWATLFGAQTPDEDFVETYVMAVLTGYIYRNDSFTAGLLSSLPITIPKQTDGSVDSQYADVPRDLVNRNKPSLRDKIRCILSIPVSAK